MATRALDAAATPARRTSCPVRRSRGRARRRRRRRRRDRRCRAHRGNPRRGAVAGHRDGRPGDPVSAGRARRTFVVNLFGTNDKLALNLRSCWQGPWSLPRPSACWLDAAGRGASWALAAVAVVLGLAALQEPLVTPLFAVLTPVIGFAVSDAGAASAARHDPCACRPRRLRPRAATRRATTSKTVPSPQMPDWDRRRFLITSGSIAVALGRRGRARPGAADPPAESCRPRPSPCSCRSPAAPAAAAAARRVTQRARHHPDRHAEQPLLPHRHRARRSARGRLDLEAHASRAWSTAS